MRKQLLFCVVGMCLFYGVAHAGLTKVASNAKTGTDVYVSPDFEFLSRDRNLIRVNMVTTYSKDRGENKKKGSKMAVTGVLNCKDKTLAIEKMLGTSASGVTELATVFAPEHITIDKIAEGTLMWTMQDIVCSVASDEQAAR